MKISRVLQLATPVLLYAGSAYAAAVAGPISEPLHSLETWITGPIAYALGIAGLGAIAFFIVTSHEFASVFTHMVKYVLAVAVVVGGVLAMDALFPNAVATVSNQPSTGSVVGFATIALLTVAFIAITLRDAVRGTRRAIAFIRARGVSA